MTVLLTLTFVAFLLAAVGGITLAAGARCRVDVRERLRVRPGIVEPMSGDSCSVEVAWVPTDPHGALPGHHWQGTLTVNGEIEYQRRYFKKWLAMEDAVAWMNRQSEDERAIERAADV